MTNATQVAPSGADGKIRAKPDAGGIAVRVLLRHPMETGMRKHPSTGEPIPRRFIREVICEHNDEPVLSWNWGWGVSANPYLSFRIRSGASGDRIRIRRVEDNGRIGSLATSVS